MKLALHIPRVCYKVRDLLELGKSPTRRRWWSSPLGGGPGVLTWEPSLDSGSTTLVDSRNQKFPPSSLWKMPVTYEHAHGGAPEHQGVKLDSVHVQMRVLLPLAGVSLLLYHRAQC